MFPIFIFLAVLGAAYWLDRSLARYSSGQAEFSKQKPLEDKRLKYLLLAFALLVLPVAAQADSITVPLVRQSDKLIVADIETYLDSNSVLPLMNDTAYLLAVNLWQAQFIAQPFLHQADSLYLSEQQVLRAISLSIRQYSVGGVWFGDSYCDQSNCVIVWLQSNVATNDLARATLTPAVLDFGNVNIIVPQRSLATPEPGTLSLVSIGIAMLGLTAYLKRRP
jgi:hypothetical protein